MTNIMMEKIVSITEVGYKDAIDIEVFGNHLFFANDILTHNSNSDPGLEDTSESFGLPATADFMFALVTNEDLEALNQILVKQLKNRYSDPSYFKRFVVGIDKPKMRLYDTEQSAQDDILDSGQENIPDKPLNTFGNRESKFNRNFSGLKV